MATLLRPPLVFDRRQKRPIGSTEIPPNLLTSTLFATTQRIRQALEQWDDSAPPRDAQVYVDPVPNLLMSTLVQVGTTIPLPLAAEQLDDSAPRRWRLNQIDHLRSLALGINPNARVMQWSDSAPQIERVLPNDLVRPFALGINPNAKIAQLYESAPSREWPACTDHYASLLSTTLAPVGSPVPLPLSAEMESDSAPRAKSVLAIDFYRVPLTLGINPNAAVLGLSDSAVPRPRQVRDDVFPNLLGTTLGQPAALTLPLIATRWDVGAPRARATGLDVAPNLLATTLAATTVPLPLVAIRWTDSAPSVRRLRDAEYVPNTLVLKPVPAVRVHSESAPMRVYVRLNEPVQDALALYIASTVVVPVSGQTAIVYGPVTVTVNGMLSTEVNG